MKINLIFLFILIAYCDCAPSSGCKDEFKTTTENYDIAPEDDPLATRTLFVQNLEVNITDEELRRIFTRYGVCEDIDIKRPPPGTGNAYAFVRFLNLDMAAKAKQDLSGQYIGKFQCKIGYGKANPTNKVWIGGLGSWTTLNGLERELDRFGSIKKIEWVKGEPECYVTFETIDAAAACVKDLRGYPLGGADKRVRTDFADAGGGIIINSTSGGPSSGGGRRDEFNTSADYNELIMPIEENLIDAQLVWRGEIIFLNKTYRSEILFIKGNNREIYEIMKNEEEKYNLRITSTINLEEAKEELIKKSLTATSFGIFVSVAPWMQRPANSDDGSSSVRAHPLKNLVAYLRSKDAAGVITLTGGGVLYAFPPSEFTDRLVGRSAPTLKVEPDAQHLTIVVIRGPN